MHDETSSPLKGYMQSQTLVLKVNSCSQGVEEFTNINRDAFWLCSLLDAISVEVKHVKVHDSDSTLSGWG